RARSIGRTPPIILLHAAPLARLDRPLDRGGRAVRRPRARPRRLTPCMAASAGRDDPIAEVARDRILEDELVATVRQDLALDDHLPGVSLWGARDAWRRTRPPLE